MRKSRRPRFVKPTVELLGDRTMPSVVPLGTDFLLNNYQPGDQVTSSTMRPAVAQGSDGNRLVVWTSDKQDGNGLGVFARLVGASGATLGGEIQVNSAAHGDQQDPAVAADSQGHYVVTWSSKDSGNVEIFGQRFDAGGNKLGSEFLVNSLTNDDQTQSAVAFDDNGNFLVTWTSKTSDELDVFARRFDASGTPLGLDFLVNTTTDHKQESPAVAFDASTRTFLIAWESDHGSGRDVFGQRLDSSGAKRGGEVLLNQTTGHNQIAPSLLADGGAFNVTWSSDASGHDVVTRWFDAATGAALSNEIVLNSTASGHQEYGGIAALGGNEYLAVWASDSDGHEILGQRFDRSGQKLGAEFVVNSSVSADQESPFIAGGNGSALVVWSGRQSGNWDVYGRVFAQSGIVVSSSTISTTEAGDTALFEVALTSQPTANVTIGVHSSNPSEGATSVSSLTFTASNWNVPQIVVVTGIDDLVVDGDVGYAILFEPAVSSDATFSGLAAAAIDAVNADDDTAGFIVGAISGPTTEAGGQATFTVRLTSQPTSDVTIAVSSSNPAEGQLPVTSLTFTASNWNVAQIVTITGKEDSIADGDQSYAITLLPATSADAVYQGLNPTDVTVVNRDDDVAGIRVSPISGPTSEAGGSATFTVVLDSQPSANVTIGLSSSDPSEGTVAAGSVTFTPANWNVAQTVVVQGSDDGTSDGDRAFFIVTSQATSADTAYAALNPADVTVTNLDDEPASGVVISPVSGPTTEGGGIATFTIALSRAPLLGPVTIAIDTGDASEGTVGTPLLTFGLFDWSTPQTVTIVGADDGVADGDRPYVVHLSVAATLDVFYLLLTQLPDVTLVNQDDDIAGVVVSPLNGPTTEAGGAATFDVALSSRPLANVVVPIHSGNPAEATVSTGSLTFTPENWNIAQTVTVTGVDDLVVDGDVGYAIVLDPAQSGDSTYQGMNPADVVGINGDDDVAGILVTPLSGPTTEAGGTATFTIALTSQPTAPVIVALSVDRPGEASVNLASVTFTAANWNLPQTVVVKGKDDFVADDDQAFNVITSPATSGDANYQGRDAANVAGVNRDDDVAGFIVGPISGATTEAGGTATFTVALTSQPGGIVQVQVASSDPAEASVSTVLLTFDATNWNVAQTVTVTGIDDFVDDGDQTYLVNLSAATSSDADYQGRASGDVAFVNSDDDVAGLVVSLISGPTSETGDGATFTAVLTSQPTTDVFIPLSSSSIGEGVATSSLLFTPTNWNVVQTVTVQGVDDPTVDGDVGYAILLQPAQSDDANYQGVVGASVAAVNRDDDVAGFALTPLSGPTSESGPGATFSIVLTSRPIADVTVDVTSSDAGEGSLPIGQVTFTAANWNVAQFVTVVGVDDHVVDGDRAFEIQFRVNSADPLYSGLVLSPVAALNLDDDVTPVKPTPGNGGGTPTNGNGTGGATGGNPTPNAPVNPTPGAPTIPGRPGGLPPIAVIVLETLPNVLVVPNPPTEVVTAISKNPEADKVTPRPVEPIEAPPPAAVPPAVAPQTPPAVAPLARPVVEPPIVPVPPSPQALAAPAPPPVVMALPAPVQAIAPTIEVLRSQLQSQLAAQVERFGGDVERVARTVEANQRVVTVALTTTAAVTAGYALIASQVVNWAVALLMAQPLWRRFDALEILYAWDDEKRRRRAAARQTEGDESLSSLVTGNSQKTPA